MNKKAGTNNSGLIFLLCILCLLLGMIIMNYHNRCYDLDKSVYYVENVMLNLDNLSIATGVPMPGLVQDVVNSNATLQSIRHWYFNMPYVGRILLSNQIKKICDNK